MDRKTFEEIVEREVIERVRDLLIRKGAEYANDADRLANFKRQAEKQGQTVLEVWKQFYAKHADSLDTYFTRVKQTSISMALADVERSRIRQAEVSFTPPASDKELVDTFLLSLSTRLPDAMREVDATLSEPIEGRLLDVIVYCSICVALLKAAREGSL